MTTVAGLSEAVQSRNLVNRASVLVLRRRNPVESLATDHPYEPAGFVRPLK